MKNTYISPDMEFVLLDSRDLIATSFAGVIEDTGNADEISFDVFT